MYIFPGQTLEFENTLDEEDRQCSKKDDVQILMTFLNIVKLC